METWSTHHLFQKASAEIDVPTASEIQSYANKLRNKNLPVIFSLNHLSRITGVDYTFLYQTVNRKRDNDNYSIFSIHKRSGGKRYIHVANHKLYNVQQFINDIVLQRVTPHPTSFAFHPSGGIKKCAATHCGCKWLIKFDLKDFFYTIKEPAVFNVFLEMGYRKLLSFELTRLCTTTFLPEALESYIVRRTAFSRLNENMFCVQKETNSYPYGFCSKIGVLPQGVSTSPMLSNLVAKRLDESLFNYAQNNGLVYSRYADDLSFSGSILPSTKSISRLRHEIVLFIRKCGFQENPTKFHVSGPGAKKMVLGLLVDGNVPRLSKEFRKGIDGKIYSAEKFGIESAATHYGFDSVYGFFNHLSGLMAYIYDVDKKYWNTLNTRFNKIKNDLNIN